MLAPGPAMDSIRNQLRHQRLALALALAALVLAVVGGPMVADAARRLITGARIAKGTITGKHVKNRSLRRKDFARGQLPAGPRGPQGQAGARGPEGPAGPFPDGNLPSGKTLRGNFYATDLGGVSTGNEAFDSISFGFQLASAPAVEIREPASAATTGCPGSASDPQAAPGKLCIYVVDAQAVVNTRDPVAGGTDTANRFGTTVVVYD